MTKYKIVYNLQHNNDKYIKFNQDNIYGFEILRRMKISFPGESWELSFMNDCIFNLKRVKIIDEIIIIKYDFIIQTFKWNDIYYKTL